MTDCPRWYAVHTRSNFEQRVFDELTEATIESCYPSIEQLSARKDRRQILTRPLFPGYLFIHLHDEPHSRQRVTRIPGVVQIVGAAGRIEPIPDIELEGVRRLLAATRRCSAHPLLRTGQRVRVVRGPLQGVEGRLNRIKNRSRIAVSVMLLSTSISAEIDVSDVEPLS